MKYIFLLIIILIGISAKTQDYVDLMNQRANIYQTKNKFDDQWGSKKYERGKGWKQFKRWENFWTPRLFPSGDFIDPSLAFNETEKYYKSHSQQKSTIGNWTSLGPAVIPQGGGVGRLNCISFHPTQANVMWVSAGAGGLWKTTNSGTGWITNTDKLPALGMANLIVDPLNNQIMYLGTGDVDASDTYGVGVLKSTDGGNTWNTTGLTWLITQTYVVNKIVMSPANNNLLFAATNNGLYKSTDAAYSWVRLKTGSFTDIEFKPNDPNIIYAVISNKFFKSINAGSTFNPIGTGLNISGSKRLAIAVTPANSAYVYLLSASSGDYSFAGLYLSEDSGTSFLLQSSYPNILSWEADGSGAGGQGWYDLALAVSPFDPDVVYVGGINIFRSYDKGTSWDCIAHWYGANGLPYVHADIHDLAFSPHNPNQLFACCDGGIFISNDAGDTWNDFSSGLVITQIYKSGMDSNDQTGFLTGNQDNGTNRYLNGVWDQVLGGDGMNCITHGNDMYGSIYYGDLYYSSNGGNYFNNISYPITSVESGAWVTPFVLSTLSPSTIYAGYNNVWKSTNHGTNWTTISNFNINPNGDKIDVLNVAPSNDNYIYFSKLSSIYMTSNGGAGDVWTNINGNLPGYNITSITIHPTNPSKIWVTFSGYGDGQKVFFSIDAGTTWTNISGSLPNVPVNCSVYENNTSDAIYIGTDIGVFYKNNNMSDWIQYNGGLPNTIVNDLEIIYTKQKIRAATYGRGVWEADLFNFANVVPYVDFSADKVQGCKGTTVQYSDSSKFNPVSWLWEFEGGVPSTSALQNPIVTYNTSGVFYSKLTADNLNGSSSTTKNNFINIKQTSIPFTEDFESFNASLNRFNVFKSAKSNVFLSSNDASNTSYFLVLEGSLGYSDYVDPGSGDPYLSNLNYISKASLCVDASSVQTLMLKFDYKQLFEGSNNFTTLRVTANGNIVGGIYRPAGATTIWHTESIDLSSYAGTEVEIAFEASNKSVFNHLLVGRGNATLIDNINLSIISNISKKQTENFTFNIISNPSDLQNSIRVYVTGMPFYELKITNALGENIYSENIANLNQTKDINTGFLSTGVYLISISDGTYTYSKKFIKF